MKKWIYLLAIGATWLFTACHDITVGYLMVDDTAGYPKDTMIVLTKAENELQRLKNVEASFYLETQEIQDRIEVLENEIWDLEDATNYWDVYDDALTEAEENDPNFWNDPDNMYRVEAEVREELGLAPLDRELKELKTKLTNLIKDFGFESLEILKSDIESWQNKVNFKLSYLSSKIDGVAGTAILYYRVIDVKSENQENANRFMDYVEAKGDGFISVAYNPDVPVGAYLLTLEVKNEGRSEIIEDVFTVIVKDVPEEAPIPMPGE